MLAEQVAAFYPDLGDRAAPRALAMVHSRFSTNTFPSWERAHPFRLISHNGEINTLSGNRAWMEARESMLETDVFGEAIEDFKPIMRPGGSDSASLDNVVDFLVASGRSLPHVMMMLIPKAYANDPDMSDEEKAFYAYHGCLVEPWDGPAAVAFTDGVQVGAMLDRNGLRPAKYASPPTGWSCWRRSSACCRSIPRASCKRGACSRARCSSSTPTPGASSPTRRSSTTSRRRSRIASGSTRIG